MWKASWQRHIDNGQAREKKRQRACRFVYDYKCKSSEELFFYHVSWAFDQVFRAFCEQGRKAR